MRLHLAQGHHIFETIPQTNQQYHNQKLDSIKSEIENTVVELGGALQLSLSQLSSPSITRFIVSIISLSGNYVLQHPNEVFDPSTFYRGASRNSFKKKIIQHALTKSQKARNNLLLFSKYIS